MIVIVPLADQHGDNFEIFFNGQKQSLALPLEFNGVLALRPLAFYLGVPEAKTLSKKDLLAGIEQRLSFIPHKTARKTWPELDRVQEWVDDGCDVTWEFIEKNLAIMRDLIPRVQAETPWLLPHALITVEMIADFAGALERYEEREAAKAEAAEAAAADPKEPETLTA